MITMISKSIALTLVALLVELGRAQEVKEEKPTVVTSRQPDPVSIYREHKAQIDGGLRSWKLDTLVGACKSIEGNCDVGALITLDGIIADGRLYQEYSEYKNYCWEQWMTRCDPQEALRVKITKKLSAEQRNEVKSLAQGVLFAKEGPNPDIRLRDLRYRYPQAIVDYMQYKVPDELEAIRKRSRNKRKKFVEVFNRIVLNLCNLVTIGLKAHIEALNRWVYEKSMDQEDLSPSTKKWLDVYRICGRIFNDKESARKYSYRYFSGKLMNE